MSTKELRYSPSGHVMVLPGDDADAVVDALVDTDYDEEFCLSPSFEPTFVAAFMAAGFLVMSLRMESDAAPGPAILLPKLHVERAVLELGALREPRSARRLLRRYELRVDIEFESVLDRCRAIHGDEWLTEELCESFRGIRLLSHSTSLPEPDRARIQTRMCSYVLFRDGRIVAGEFGTVVGGVYTSYSGYREESSAGTVQMILTARYLRDAGFSFWDLGMPMAYKETLGALSIGRKEFVSRFREARARSIQSSPTSTVRA